MGKNSIDMLARNLEETLQLKFNRGKMKHMEGVFIKYNNAEYWATVIITEDFIHVIPDEDHRDGITFKESLIVGCTPLANSQDPYKRDMRISFKDPNRQPLILVPGTIEESYEVAGRISTVHPSAGDGVV